MNKPLTRFEIIHVLNIVLTLILSGIAVFLSYNSYRISKNTFTLSEKVEKLNKVQSNNEFKSSVFTLFTTIDMQMQNDSNVINLIRCITTLKEMKSILESQLKSSYLGEHSEIADLWIEMNAQINFDIRFLEQGLKPNTSIVGAKDIIRKYEKQTQNIFHKFLNSGKERIDSVSY